jgi:hypothetical protein
MAWIMAIVSSNNNLDDDSRLCSTSRGCADQPTTDAVSHSHMAMLGSIIFLAMSVMF